MYRVSLPFSNRPPRNCISDTKSWGTQLPHQTQVSDSSPLKLQLADHSLTSTVVSLAVFPTAFLHTRPARCNYSCDFSLLLAHLGDTVPWGGRCSLTAHWSPVCCSGVRRLWLNSFPEARSTPSLHNCTSSSFCYWIQGLWEITAIFTVFANTFQ